MVFFWDSLGVEKKKKVSERFRLFLHSSLFSLSHPLDSLSLPSPPHPPTAHLVDLKLLKPGAHGLHHVQKGHRRRPLLVRDPLGPLVVHAAPGLAPGRQIPRRQLLDDGLRKQQALEQVDQRGRGGVRKRSRGLGRDRDRRVERALRRLRGRGPPERLGQRQRVDDGGLLGVGGGRGGGRRLEDLVGELRRAVAHPGEAVAVA